MYPTAQTIRDYFKRRNRRTLAAVGIGVAVMAIAAVLGYLFSEVGGSQYPYAMLAVAVVGLAIVFGGLLYLDRTSCPRCLGRIGPGLFMGVGINFCPHCGASLDGQMPLR